MDVDWAVVSYRIVAPPSECKPKLYSQLQQYCSAVLSVMILFYLISDKNTLLLQTSVRLNATIAVR